MGITRRPELDCNRWLGRCVRVWVLLGVLCAWAPAVNPAQGPTSWLQGCRGPSTTVRWPAYTDWSAPLQAHGRSMGLRGGDSEEGSASDDQLIWMKHERRSTSGSGIPRVESGIMTAHGDDETEFLPTRRTSQEAFPQQLADAPSARAAATMAPVVPAVVSEGSRGGAAISCEGTPRWDLGDAVAGHATTGGDVESLPGGGRENEARHQNVEPARLPRQRASDYRLVSHAGGSRRFIFCIGGPRGHIEEEGDPKYAGYLAASRGAWRYDNAMQRWQAIAPMSRMRSMGAACSYEGRCIVAGGFDNDHETTCSVEAYNSRSDTWERMARLIIPRDSFAMVATDGQLLAIGGWDHRHRLVADVERYDASQDLWVADSNHPMPAPRGGLAAISHEGLVYVAGGFGDDGDVSDVVQVYNPLLGTWLLHPQSLHRKRAMCAGVSFGGFLYVGGGLDVTDGEVLDSVERFDLSSQTWQQVAPMTRPRAGHHMLVLPTPSHGLRMCAVAGFTSLDFELTKDGAKMIQTDTIEYYDPEADAWQLVTDFNLPAPCYGAAMCVT